MLISAKQHIEGRIWRGYIALRGPIDRVNMKEEPILTYRPIYTYRKAVRYTIMLVTRLEIITALPLARDIRDLC